VDLSEKRQHQRLEITHPVQLKINGQDLEAVLTDISLGGAKVEFPTIENLSADDEVELLLTLPHRFSISVFCSIKRLTKSDQKTFLGLQYRTGNAPLEKQLSEFFHFFLQESNHVDGQLPKISRRLPIRCGQLSDLEAIIENISMGGVALTTEQELELYDDIELSIPNLEGEELLVVKGKIMHQFPIDDHYFRVGIEFQELSKPSKRCLQELMYEILEVQIVA